MCRPTTTKMLDDLNNIDDINNFTHYLDDETDPDYNETDPDFIPLPIDNEILNDQSLLTQIKNDLDNLFKYERVYLRDSDCFNNIMGDEQNDYICVVVCQFCISDEEIENVNLHYGYNYWGSNEFQEILEKYGLMFEWYDSCIGVVFKPQ